MLTVMGYEQPRVVDDAGSLLPLVRAYVKKLGEMAGEMELARREGRIEELVRLVHRVRGTAGTYGFAAITEAAGRCEKALRGGTGEAPLDELLELMRAAGVAGLTAGEGAADNAPA